MPFASAPAGPSVSELYDLVFRRNTQRHPEAQRWVVSQFWRRWNRSRVPADKLLLALMLVIHVMSVIQNRGTVFSSARPSNQAYALAFGAALATSLCWAHAAPDAYAAWRELATFVISLAGLAAPCTWELSRQALEEASLWQAGPWLGAAAFWGCLTFSTMLPFPVLLGLCWPRRCLLHWATQAALLAVVLSHLPDVCDAPLLAHPASAAQVQGVQAAMRFMSAAFALPASALDTTPPSIQCRCVLSVLLFMLGFVLPVLFPAVWEYEEYQRWAQEQLPPPPPQQHSPVVPSGPVRVQGLEQRGIAEQACRLVGLLLMLLMLAATVWDICMKLY